MFDNVILIPYRDREDHLNYFLNNSWTLIKGRLADTKLVIIEQEEGKLFNRGKLLNVGFKEYLDKTKYFITHDVDVNPLNDVIKLYEIIPEKEEVVGIYSSPLKTLGGVIKTTSLVIKKINGFPNTFWGWGVEDRALYNRAKYFDIKIRFNIITKTKEALDNFKIFDDKNDRIRDNLFTGKTEFEYRLFDKLGNNEKYAHIFSSGLNNLKYDILERKNLAHNVEIIKVSI